MYTKWFESKHINGNHIYCTTARRTSIFRAKTYILNVQCYSAICIVIKGFSKISCMFNTFCFIIFWIWCLSHESQGDIPGLMYWGWLFKKVFRFKSENVLLLKEIPIFVHFSVLCKSIFQVNYYSLLHPLQCTRVFTFYAVSLWLIWCVCCSLLMHIYIIIDSFRS